MASTISARGTARHHSSKKLHSFDGGLGHEFWQLPTLSIDEFSGALVVMELDEIVRVTAISSISNRGYSLH